MVKEKDEEYFRLSQAEADAYREYQQKFDALKDFDRQTLSSVNNVERIRERDKLEAAEQAAYEKRESAIKAFAEYRQQKCY